MARVKRSAAYRWAVRGADLLAHWFPGLMVVSMLALFYQLLARRSLPLFLCLLVFPLPSMAHVTQTLFNI